MEYRNGTLSTGIERLPTVKLANHTNNENIASQLFFKCHQCGKIGFSEQSHERQTPQAENFPSDDVDDKNKHHKEITVKLDSHTNKSSHFKCHQCGKIGFRSP